ncbi:hypothetical protein Mapa_014120 [Marchantia paleacea]|nr:hypothetical protein Mapa_014120 [Marchantia paleacea]
MVGDKMRERVFKVASRRVHHATSCQEGRKGKEIRQGAQERWLSGQQQQALAAAAGRGTIGTEALVAPVSSSQIGHMGCATFEDLEPLNLWQNCCCLPYLVLLEIPNTWEHENIIIHGKAVVGLIFYPLMNCLIFSKNDLHLFNRYIFQRC